MARRHFVVERGGAFEDCMYQLIYEINNDYENGQQSEFENDVFALHPYWWGDCTCEYEDRFTEKEAAWHAENKHSADCYHTELVAEKERYDRESGYAALDAELFGRQPSLLDGFEWDVESPDPHVITMVGQPRTGALMEEWRKAYARRNEFLDALYDRLCKKYGKQKFGCAIHCTCDYEAKWKAFCAADGHDADCKLERPNFLYKPTGYELEWYKYPLRGAVASADLNANQFAAMIDHCVQSLRKEA